MVSPTQQQVAVMQKLRAQQAPSQPTSSGQDTGSAIAALLVNAGYLTEGQLAHARKVQSKLATPATLLHVLYELQFVTPAQLQQTLRTNQVSVRLGDLLVELGYLRVADLKAALDMQKNAQQKKKLGEILVEGHFIEERRFAEVLAYQLGFAYVEPNFAELDQALLSKGSGKSYAEHLFIPVTRQDSQVVVAFADPLDKRAREAAESAFGKDLVPAIATKAAIHEALTLLMRGAHQSRAIVLNDSTVVGRE